VICEEIGGFARDGQALLARYQKELVASVGLQPPRHQPSGEGRQPDFTVFRDVDVPWCPEMVALPAGEFLMGSPEDEEGRDSDEGPQHRVRIGSRFALGRYPVTFADYDHFCDMTQRQKPEDQSWGRGRRPVINVSWNDAKNYCEWLAEATGKPYRLPSEAEWEYACRAGTTTRYAFGGTITEKEANFGLNLGKPTEVGAYPANVWGLHDMHGNVWEWITDHWQLSFEGLDGVPADGNARVDVNAHVDAERMIRGGSWIDEASFLRSASRLMGEPGNRYGYLGFRCARTLD
jgi:formylglycine-generating enzyme required for sulfatase activity